ncbi:glycine receptor subunit alpha-3-like [Saccoglossus kowalevskii]
MNHLLLIVSDLEVYTIIETRCIVKQMGIHSERPSFLAPCENNDLNSMFSDNRWRSYDHRLRPNFMGSPVVVTCFVWISSLHSVSEITMDYGVTMFLIERWTDPRLEFNGTEAIDLHSQSNLIDNIWTPDLYFVNEKEGRFHTVTVDNKQIRIYPNGTIIYDIRVSVTLSCSMHLHKFPMDKQSCGMQIETFGYTTKDVIIQWDETNPVYVAKDLELPQFSLGITNVSRCYTNYPLGDYGCLQIVFPLHRELTYYILETYAPSALLVILSWVSFWMHIDATPARASLGITTVLTLTTLSSGARDALPKVSYTKAIDVWMAGCSLFVFAALIEFATVNFLHRTAERSELAMVKKRLEMRDQYNSKKKAYSESVRDVRLSLIGERLALNGDSCNSHTANIYISDDYMEMRASYHRRKAQRMDKLARVVFPTAFLLFNAAYWAIYLGIK